MKAVLFNSKKEKFDKILHFNSFLFNSNSEIPNYCNSIGNKSETPLVGGVKSKMLSWMEFGSKCNKK